jgi:hypothetical protein
VGQKRELDQWAAQRREEAEQQAARLVAREAELRRQQAEIQDHRQRWQVERLENQRELHRLRLRLTEREDVALPA